MFQPVQLKLFQFFSVHRFRMNVKHLMHVALRHIMFILSHFPLSCKAFSSQKTKIPHKKCFMRYFLGFMQLKNRSVKVYLGNFTYDHGLANQNVGLDGNGF